MAAFLISFGVIFIAELGDKSQLMALTFAARYRPLLVLIGLSIATAIVHLISVTIGAVLGLALPTRALSFVAAIAFFGFAAWTLRGDELSDEEQSKAARSTGSAILAVSGAFMLAELGDKTMLATITLATDHGFVGTWLGSTLGMIAADALAIALGAQLAARLSQRTIQYGAAALFAIFGVVLLVEAIRG